MQNNIYLKGTIWWFDACVHYEMIAKTELVNITLLHVANIFSFCANNT
jgi:hypothetical protein